MAARPREHDAQPRLDSIRQAALVPERAALLDSLLEVFRPNLRAWAALALLWLLLAAAQTSVPRRPPGRRAAARCPGRIRPFLPSTPMKRFPPWTALTRRILLTGAVAATIVAAAWVEENIRGERKYRAFRGGLRRKRPAPRLRCSTSPRRFQMGRTCFGPRFWFVSSLPKRARKRS